LHLRNHQCRSSNGSLLPPFFKCLRVRPCECGCIHEDTLFTLSRLVPFNSSSDGWSNCRDAWPYFPGIKVGLKLIPILPFWQFLVGLIINRYVVTRTMFIPELKAFDCNCFLSPFLFFLSEDSLKISFVGMTADQACFVSYLAIFSVGRKPSHSKIFQLETLEAKWNKTIF
jgi:hypothetical protein